jgi:polyhydroxyalkanoate synthesis repressor PhaR
MAFIMPAAAPAHSDIIACQPSCVSRSAAMAASSLCHSVIQSRASSCRSGCDSGLLSAWRWLSGLAPSAIVCRLPYAPDHGWPSRRQERRNDPTADWGFSLMRHLPIVMPEAQYEEYMADPVRTEPEIQASHPPPVVVKKYANRRLYNTESSSYITLDNLADMVRLGRDFVVYDAKTGDDITRSVLTQIIVEEEAKGRALLPTGFLRQLIGFYGDSMQGLVPPYLDHAMTAFAQQQEQIRATMQRTMGNLFPFTNIEEMSRQNIAMMERALSLFTPFYHPPEPSTPQSPEDDAAQEIAALRAENERLRQELELKQAAAAKSETI